MLNYGILEKYWEKKKTSSSFEVPCLSDYYYRPNGSDGIRSPRTMHLIRPSRIYSSTK